MIIVVTSITLRSPWKFFRLSLWGRRIMLQAKADPACRAFKNTGFWKLHHTLSAWDSHEAMRRFALSGDHKAAMKESAALSTEIRTLHFEGDQVPAWPEAKARLLAEGKVMRFG